MITHEDPARKLLYWMDYLTVVIAAPFTAAYPLPGGAGCAADLLLLDFLISTLVRRPRKKDAA